MAALSSFLSLACSRLSVAHALVELLLLRGRLDPEVLGGEARLLDGLVDRRERRLIAFDLLGERLVLLAHVDHVARLGEDVGERAAGQEGLEQRRPVGVVGAPDAQGELVLLIGETGGLLGLLRRELRQLRIELLAACDQRGVGRLDLLDLLLHARDALLDRDEVGVDRLELGLGRRDVLGDVALERVQPGDLALLLLDLLLELRLAGACFRQLVSVGVRRIGGSAERPEQERQSEEEEEESATRTLVLSRRVPGDGLLLVADTHQARVDIVGVRSPFLSHWGGAGHVD